ncbi:hypothetical protein AVEN_52237-1, partial [Araneus ventricosus]
GIHRLHRASTLGDLGRSCASRRSGNPGHSRREQGLLSEPHSPQPSDEGGPEL